MSRTDEIIAAAETAFRQGRLRRRPGGDGAADVITGFFPSGRPQFRYTVRDGRLHGEGRAWFVNGRPAVDEAFYDGRLHGMQRCWHDNGRLASETWFHKGFRHGRRREWSPGGSMTSECVYRRDVPHGPLAEWREGGMIALQGRYLDGDRHGVWTEYEATGRCRSRTLYVAGVEAPARIQRRLCRGRIDAAFIRSQKNAAVRRILLEELGYARFCAQLPHSVLDADGDEQLLRIDWHADEEPLVLVKVRCPSTGTFYTLRVPPAMATVRAAVAWTFGMEEDEYRPAEES